MIIPVILSGGSGSRLWPLSREAIPSNFCPGGSQHHAAEHRVADRGAGRRNRADGGVQRRSTASWSPSSCARSASIPAAVILEPIGRNTAPAVAVAACTPSTAGRRSDSADPAGRSRHRRCRRLSRRRAASRAPRRSRPVDHLRHRSDRPGNRLRLHQGRRAAGRVRRMRRGALRRKARRSPPHSAICNPALIPGTAACSCFAPLPFWRNWSASPRRCWPPANRR
jgi:hypothetical protein